MATNRNNKFSYGERVTTNADTIAKKYRNKVLTVNHHFKDNRVLLVADDGTRMGVNSQYINRI